MSENQKSEETWRCVQCLKESPPEEPSLRCNCGSLIHPKCKNAHESLVGCWMTS